MELVSVTLLFYIKMIVKYPWWACHLLILDRAYWNYKQCWGQIPLALSIYVYWKVGLGFRPSNISFMQLRMKVCCRFLTPEVFCAEIQVVVSKPFLFCQLAPVSTQLRSVSKEQQLLGPWLNQWEEEYQIWNANIQWDTVKSFISNRVHPVPALLYARVSIQVPANEITFSCPSFPCLQTKTCS